jgi:hypothetical protein
MSSKDDLSVDWKTHFNEEPDLVRLRQAQQLIETDPVKALSLLEQLSEEGSVISRLMVGDMYSSGVLGGPDLQAAEIWYRKAADAGSLSARYYLGRQYRRQARHEKALHEFQFAAARGYVPAIHFLGRAYLLGNGVAKDRKRARQLFERAAEQGNIPAKAAVASMIIADGPTLCERLEGYLLRISALYDFARTVFKDRGKSERLL